MILRLAALADALTKRVAELEARLGQPPKTPENSSTPPSRALKAAVVVTASPVGRKRRRKGRKGAFRALHPAPDHIRDVRLSRCPRCAGDVRQARQTVREAYDMIDLPPVTPVVTRVNLHGGRCPHCAGRFKAPAPQDMPPGSPFGAGLRAMVFYLRFTQGIALDRLSRLLEECFGVSISQGALVNMLAKASGCFAGQFARIRTRLLSGAALASDETSLRIGGRNGWLWVVHHGDSAAFIADHSRGKRVLEDFLGARRPAFWLSFWLSGRFCAQKGFASQGHQYCLAHLIRDAQYAIDAGDAVFAPGLIALFRRACRIGRERPQLSDGQLRAYEGRFREKLGKLLLLQPTQPEGIALRKAIAASRHNLFVFLTQRALEPTNNASERALPFRKITNGFRTDWGATFYAHVRSVIETARRRGIPLLHAINLTLNGKSLAFDTS